MAKGWEVAIGVQNNSAGWDSQTSHTSSTIPHWWLYVDSETLGKNTVVKERDEKIMPTRLSPVQSASNEQTSPSGEIVWQPRADDSVGAFFACFQWGTFYNGAWGTAYGGTGGTFVLTPVGRSLTWSGTLFATSSVFPVNVTKYYGQGLLTSSDGEVFRRGVVTRLSLEQDRESDLIARAEFKFLTHSGYLSLGTGFKSQPNAYGSYSQSAQFVDWNATLTVGGVSTYAIERISFEFDNLTTDRRKLGQKGFFQFPFGRFQASGEFEVELDDLAAFTEGTTEGTLSCRWQNAAGQWMEVFMPNIFIRAWDINVSDTGPILITVPFRAYPTAFGGTNAVELSIYPGYGTGGPPNQTRVWLN